MRKVCKNCRLFVTSDICPLCKRAEFADGFKGRITIIDPEKSEIAKKLNIKNKGEYAIKV
ncbi:DNA-directed RNA polymerase subunit E'' [Candidatus Woesearchaeota archaeon]|nr:DNA-directed RNA polymerase subunit E'' [Candidatus Woesearchaeota archaeon]